MNLRLTLRRLRRDALLVVGCLWGSTIQARDTVPPKPQAGQTGTGSFSFVQTRTNGLQYLLYLPKNYDSDDTKRFPLVLFLHGSGERGSEVERVAIHGPPKQAKAGKELPFILVSPQCPAEQRWEPETLMALVAFVEKDFRVDTHREYVTGLSMGGYGTWALGARYPEHFAAIAPICGGGERIHVILGGQKGEALKSLGIWAFHGAKDPVVPLEESQRMVSAFSKTGNKDVKLTIYPEAGHDSWTQAYDEPELYTWLLRHLR